MAELTENTAAPVEQEFDTAAPKDQTSLIEAFENALEISQHVDWTACAASGDTDSRGKPEQRDRQQDGQMDSPPAADSSRTESKAQWAVGAQCRAVWSEDGQVYPATVAAVDGDRCTVRFHGYGNEEDVELSALRSPDAALQTQRQNSEVWKPGSRCRAVYSEDGLVYPAVVLWVKGQRCCVRFDNYNNEEEQEVDSLLNFDELHGPSRAAAAKGISWKSSGSSNSDWKRRKREESQGEGGGERRSVWRDDQQSFSWVKPSNESQVEKESKEKKHENRQRDGGQKPTNQSFSFFPPFPPPPPQPGSGSLCVSPGPHVLHPSSSSSCLGFWWERVRQRRRRLQHADAVVHVWLPHRQLPGSAGVQVELRRLRKPHLYALSQRGLWDEMQLGRSSFARSFCIL